MRRCAIQPPADPFLPVHDQLRRLRREARKRAKAARKALEGAARSAGAAADRAARSATEAAASTGRAVDQAASVVTQHPQAQALRQSARRLLSNKELAETHWRVTVPRKSGVGAQTSIGQVKGSGIPPGVRDAAVATALVVGVVAAASAVAGAVSGRGWMFFKGRGESAEGRWVRDRSLGGRLVRVETPNGATAMPNPLEGVEGAERRATTPNKRTSPAPAPGDVVMPAWWDRPVAVSVPESVRERAGREATALLRRMESDKVAGRDVPIEVSALQ